MPYHIDTRIDHEVCLARWLAFDVMTIGDPDAPLLSPCCEHGYRAVWDRRRIINYRLPYVPNRADEDRIQPPWEWQSWHGGGLYETVWNWHDNRGSDEPEFFTGAQLSGESTSWVLVAGVTPGTGNFGYRWNGVSYSHNRGNPTGAQAKWWTTTQTDLTTPEQEASLAQGHTLAGLTGWRADNVNTTDGLGVGTGLPSASAVMEFDRAGGASGYSVYWVKYGPRTYQGITACADPISDPSSFGTGDLHIRHGVSANWSAFQGALPTIIGAITDGPNSDGGMNPRLVLYGGDVFGARVTAPLDSAGNILNDVTVVDPGVTVVTTEGDTELVAPFVGVNMPSHYSNFEATATVSTDPSTIQATFPLLFKKQEDLIGACGDGYIDPIAQTFMINDLRYPSGIFLESVDICFAKKPASSPTPVALTGLAGTAGSSFNLPAPEMEQISVELQIRETLNGIPSAEAAIARKRLPVHRVKAADGVNAVPSFDDADTYTRFRFNYPIYLEGGSEYAIVLVSNSADYECWIADTEGTAVVNKDTLTRAHAEGDPNVTSTYGKQYGGVFFRSSNGRTWSEKQTQDLMFRVNKCVFGTSTSPTSPRTGKIELRAGGGRRDTAIEYDRIKVTMNSVLIPNDAVTKITGTLYTTDKVTETLSAVSGSSGELYNQAEEVITRDLSERMTVLADKIKENASIKTVIDLETDSPDVSPVIHTRACWVNPVKNIINNGSLAAEDIQIISDTGTGYNESETFTVSGGGSTSDATFGVTQIGGVPTGITVAGEGSGAGFHTSKDISITQTGGSGSGQEFSIQTEEGQDKGNAKARYVTRPINLATGMTARALKTFLTVHKPVGSSIHVYYKALAEEDSEDINRKKWKLMTQTTPDTDYFSGLVSGEGKQFKEYEFDSEEIISYTNTDGSTYDNFKTFAVKIVSFAENSAMVPVIKNHRSIAVF